MYFLTKLVFLHASFLNGFVWMRVGTVALALGALLEPNFRQSIFQTSKNISKQVTFIFVLNKGVSAFAFVIISYAILLGSVSLINALHGIEYVFILVLSLALSYFLPGMLRESFSLAAIIQKALGIGLISAGVALLFLT